ncbi:MAG: hypothetical protein QOI65_262, partial [Thermoleophilaceae bacterium]|nr:hypothetical protein [Thermoleophilaceae bacterium]
EVTPDILRLRKAVLDGGSRRKTARAAKTGAAAGL